MMDDTATKTLRRARKRGDGEGSIDQVREGLWRARLMVGRLPDGKPDRRTIYGKTQREVRLKLGDLRRQLDSGVILDRHQLSVAGMLDQWLQECVTRGLRPKTLAKYRQVARLYVTPHVGKLKLTDLRPEHVRKLCASLLAQGLSPATVREARNILHASLRLAVSMEIVGRNVVDAVRPPKVERAEINPPSPKDVARLLDMAVARDDRLQAFWMLAVSSGCRPGELLALQWDDIDWERGLLMIRRNLSKVNGQAATTHAPKTARGRRTVFIPLEALDALRRQRQRQLEERVRLGPDYEGDLVFATQTGAPLQHRNVIRAFKALLTQSGLPLTYRVYDLRHAHATNLLAAGVHPKAAADRLGHASVTLTLDTYSHKVPGMDAEAAAKAHRIIRGDPPTGPAEARSG